METINKYAGTVALVILAILGIMSMFGHKTSVFGSATACTDGYTCFTNLEAQGNFLTDLVATFAGGTKIGSSGTQLTQVLTATCSLIGNASVTASTTAAFDCAVAGAVSGDKVFAQAATSSPSYMGFLITGASASTTSGFVTLKIFNGNATAVVPNSIASSTSLLIVR